RKRKILLGTGIERGLVGQLDSFAPLMAQCAIDLSVIDNILFKGGWWRWKHDQVVPLAGCCLGRGPAADVIDIYVINTNFGVMFLSALSGQLFIEPSVVSGDKMLPLKNAQLLAARLGSVWK